jgi:Cys-rich protein (TIGR01571 family)
MGGFQEDLCGCCSDGLSFIIGCCVPLGWICLQASAVSTSANFNPIVAFLLTCCCQCIGGAIMRGKIREVYSIQGGFVGDCLLWLCCGPCAGCQEYREVKKRKS